MIYYLYHSFTFPLQNDYQYSHTKTIMSFHPKKSAPLTGNLFLSCIHCCIENKSRTLINGEFYLLNLNIIIQCPHHIKETQVKYVN
jgi:hypothetical protein